MIAESVLGTEDSDDSDREDSDLTHIVSSVPWNVEIINVCVVWSPRVVNTTPN